jgi:hypothetical protein
MTDQPIPMMRTEILKRVRSLNADQPVTAADAVTLAAGLLEISERAMPAAFAALDPHCQLARAVLAANVDSADGIAEPGDLPTDDFTTSLVGMCRSAIRNHDGHPYGGWSHGEQLGVALVLRDQKFLDGAGMTPTQAARRVLDGMMFPPADINVWLASVRRAVGIES